MAPTGRALDESTDERPHATGLPWQALTNLFAEDDSS